MQNARLSSSVLLYDKGENDEHIKGCNRLAQQHHVDCKFIIYYAKIIVKRFEGVFAYFLYDLYYTRPDRAKRADLLPRVLYYMRDFAVENRSTKKFKIFFSPLGACPTFRRVF